MLKKEGSEYTSGAIYYIFDDSIHHKNKQMSENYDFDKENSKSPVDKSGDVIIRKAVKSDCESMMKLIQELAVYQKSPDAVTVTLEHFIESGFGENPVWWAFVAEENNEIVAFALYYIRYSTWKGQRMYLEDLLVTDKMRGRGIGKLLFDRLLNEAENKGLAGMIWQVSDWNEPAINFYQKYEDVYFDNEWVNCSIKFKE